MRRVDSEADWQAVMNDWAEQMNTTYEKRFCLSYEHNTNRPETNDEDELLTYSCEL